MARVTGECELQTTPLKVSQPSGTSASPAGRKTERKQKPNKSCTQDFHRADSNIARALLQAHLFSISSHITVFFTHQ